MTGLVELHCNISGKDESVKFNHDYMFTKTRWRELTNVVIDGDLFKTMNDPPGVAECRMR